MRSILTLVLAASFVPFLAGCPRTTRYGDPSQVEEVNPDFGSTDLQSISAKMVQSMINHPAITDYNRPVLYFGRVVNKTSEHIDTKSITDKIRTTMLQSGKVRVTAISDIPQDLLDQAEYQASSGNVDPSTAVQLGKQVGWKYVLYGELTSIVKKSGSTKDVYYKFTLNLTDVTTGLIEWADEKEIRKTEAKRWFGV